MEILVTGLNHKTTPIALRERLAFSVEELPEALHCLSFPEAVLLSTCNRVEIYAASPDPLSAPDDIHRFLCDRHHLDSAHLSPHLYTHLGLDAARHLFRVTAGLDALAVGETQILGQVKDAYHIALTHQRTGRLLNPLFQRALHAAKRVHTETHLAGQSCSVPAVAAQLSQQVFDRLEEKTTLMVGAGETAEWTLESLRNRGAHRFLIVNRTPRKAEDLAKRFGGESHPLESLTALLPRAEIIIMCVETSQPLLLPEQITPAQKSRQNNPLLIIDLSVPRAVDPAVGRFENVYLFNVDDLQTIVAQNTSQWEKTKVEAETLIEKEAIKCFSELLPAEVSRTVEELQRWAKLIETQEVNQTLEAVKDLNERQKIEIQRMVHRIVSKMMHPPITFLRQETAGGTNKPFLEWTRRLFGLK